MSGLFNKYAEKAQNAINATPLGQYIPPQYQHLATGGNAAGNSGASGGGPQNASTNASTTTGGSNAPPATSQTGSTSGNPSPANATTGAPANAGAGGAVGGGVAGVLRQHGFSTLQNQLRNLQVQYSKGNDRQIQLAITAQKSVSLDFEGAGRDAQVYSKELYLWGQEQPEDIKDVTDRLAYLNFVHGSLSTDLANKLDVARGPWKTARATESTAGTLKQSGQSTDAVTMESEVERRNALKLGEAARWKAIREYAEKLILLSQASETLIEECLPPSEGQNYTGKQRSAEVRSTLQQSLDNWHLSPAIAASSPFKTPSSSGGGGGAKLDPRGFGETHRQELDRTPSVMDKQKADQEALAQHQSTTGAGGHGMPEAHRPAPTTMQGSTGASAPSTGVNPAQLNNAPAPVPTHSTPGSGVNVSHPPPTAASPTVPPTAPLNLSGKHSGTGAAAVGASVAALSSSTSPSSFSPPSESHVKPVVAVSDVPPNSGGGSVTAGTHPTVAETGVPIAASTQGGPGPASGSLKSGIPTVNNPSPHVDSGAGTSPTWGSPSPAVAAGAGAGAGGAKYETAEEEKKRLEREDRERFLRFGTGANKPSTASASASTPTASPLAGSSIPSSSRGAPIATSGGGGGGQQPPQNESAEEEKKRLEREERERVLRGGNGGGQPPRGGGPNDPNQDGEQLPSYKEY